MLIFVNFWCLIIPFLCSRKQTIFMLKRFLYLLIIAFAMGQSVNAQVTTSSLGGLVKAANGDALVGATVVATHEPTGTVYRTVSRTGGRFDIQNVAPGGPYTVKVTYVGYGEFSRGDIMIPLGEKFDPDRISRFQPTIIRTCGECPQRYHRKNRCFFQLFKKTNSKHTKHWP
jgi:hypothetical protein